MITEDYCSFEIAKLLKEKGFEGICDYAYSNKGNYFEIDRSNFDEVYCLRPTHSMAMKWLREKKKLFINVWYDGIDFNAECVVNIEDFTYIGNYTAYEQAVEGALKYSLKKLI